MPRSVLGHMVRVALPMLLSAAAMASPETPDTSFPVHRLPLDGVLSQNSVPSIIQDRSGLMWFATQDSVDVYDGYSFRVLSADPRDANALSGVLISRERLINSIREWISRRESGTCPDSLPLHQALTCMMREIKKLGVELSIDGFGTGFSSMSHLKMLPVDEMKIDRSFVTDVVNSPNSQKIVNSIVRLAHELQLKVVADGVEDENVVACLRSIDCDLAQGYFFGKPRPAESVLAIEWVMPGKIVVA